MLEMFKSSSKSLGFLGFGGSFAICVLIFLIPVDLERLKVALSFYAYGLMFSGLLVGNKTVWQGVQTLPLADIIRAIFGIVKKDNKEE